VLYPRDAAKLGFSLDAPKNFTPAGTVIGTIGRIPDSTLFTLASTVTLTPKPDYQGWACVQFQLVDAQTYQVLDQSYLNVQVQGPEPIYVPQLGNSESSNFNPASYFKQHQTVFIIAFASVGGVILLGAFGYFGWRRYRGSRDAADFEKGGLTEEMSDNKGSEESGSLQPTRRFYFDAKV
jgi:hypothetical protein